ncbi:MAG TPA: phosphotransferase [Pirellulales bacterium]|nr:phosphotransferase [Pirellulales bacterium]
MTDETAYRRVLHAYPPDCQPQRAEFLGGAGGFSGALFWRLQTPRGLLCLRCWPREHPSRQRLEFIQAVLWHVSQEGFRRVPLALETRTHAGYVCESGRLWELAPWLPGKADYRQSPSAERLQAALTTLAEFHLAAASFPLPDRGPALVPGIRERFERVEDLSAERFERLADAVAPGDWPELAWRAREWRALAPRAIPRVRSLLARAAELAAPLQPCIRDIWHDHVLFAGQQVAGLVDFGAMRADNVAGDIARLLGSLAGDDRQAWERGLAAYTSLRPLSPDETYLVAAFDQANTLLAGLSWLEWIYLERRQFSDRQAVIERLDANLPRLTTLAGE